MSCIFCEAGFPHELTDECNKTAEMPDVPDEVLDDAVSENKVYKDARSTGRKRAAVAAPITPGMECEWSRLRNAGGGVEPIQGCTGYPATDLHHGPDKSTFNNEVGVNLHRICSRCHNRWHAANNKFYTEPRPDNGEPWLPNQDYQEHDPDDIMTMQEAMFIEMTRNQDDKRGRQTK